MASLFGPSPQEIMFARQQQMQEQQALRQQQIAQQGQQFGIFAPLYQAGLQLGDVGTQAAMQSLFPTPVDPALQRATAVQGVLSKYQGEDMQAPEVLSKIARDLMAVSPEAGLRAAELATKFTQQAEDRDLRRRTLQVQEGQLTEQQYKNNPELLLAEAEKLDDTDPKKKSLLSRYARYEADRKFEERKRNIELAKEQADLDRIRLITDQAKSEGESSRTNNNGVRIGTFDKVGRYKAPDGTVYSAKAVEEARKGHDAAVDLIYRLEALDDDDIKNAYGSATDWTTIPGGALAASTKTYTAQTKVNAIGIRNVLNNLQQLKGPSSDKEMAQMIKDFPGYQADPDTMRDWVNRAVKETNRFLGRNEKRYGFDTDYGVENRFTTTKLGKEKNKQGTWRIVGEE